MTAEMWSIISRCQAGLVLAKSLKNEKKNFLIVTKKYSAVENVDNKMFWAYSNSLQYS